MKRIYSAVKNFTGQMKRKNISAFAASTAFFLILSTVPMLIMICAVIPYTPVTQKNLQEAVTQLTPDMIDELVIRLISEVFDKSAGALSIAALATLWSAGKGVLALTRGLNAISGVDENRNYFLLRILASLYTVVMLVVLIVSLVVMVFGNQLVNLILYKVPQIRTLVRFLMNFRFLAVWAILMLLFAAIYAYVPDQKLKFKDQLPGAAFASVGWSIFSWGFSLYVNRSNTYTIYGSLSIVVIVMLWLYFCMYIIMIGAYLNRYLDERDE